jgi:predicted nuclease with TOPRIM domain
MSEEKTIEPDVKQENDTKVENNVQDAIPRSRLNEVISQKKELETKLNEMKSMVEEKQRAELEEQGKLSELNSVLAKENEELKVIKTQFESQDTRLRNDALSRLPEDKREKFSSLPTDSLLDVVEELSSVKNNPQNNVGTVSRKDVDFKSISKEERRDNWSSILNNFKR